MNASQVSPRTWTPRRWFLWILLAFLVQCFLIWRLSGHRNRAQQLSAAVTRVHLVSPAELNAKERRGAMAQDPTLFALVTSEGFSRSAWLTLPRFSYEVTSRLDPPRWLAPPAEELADEFDDFVQTNLVLEALEAEKLAPILTRVSVPKAAAVPSALVRVEGGLAGRALLGGAKPPSPRELVMTDTVVRVLVSADGRTLSAALLASSGVQQADQEAVAFARHAKFAPAGPPRLGAASRSGEGLAFGTLTFQWARLRWLGPGSKGAAGS